MSDQNAEPASVNDPSLTSLDAGAGSSGSVGVCDAPHSFTGILKQLGPGLIIAANIVGSGELIMTTKTGAQAGIALLWLILIGCVIKVFVQLELGRFTISHGETTLTSLNRVPGPRLYRDGTDWVFRSPRTFWGKLDQKGINWIVMVWAFMMLTTVGQLGGIVGGVGQALSLTIPITGDYQRMIQIPAEADIMAYARFREFGLSSELETERAAREQARMERIGRELDAVEASRREVILTRAMAGEALVDESGVSLVTPPTFDDKIWVVAIGVLTSVVLYIGRYRLIERFSVVLVVSFTFITLGNVLSLQTTAEYAVSGADIIKGLSFGLPEGSHALTNALATLGIIGVGATELVSYPYWCLEKGYARNVGPREQSDRWLTNANGWFRVMKFDAFASMVIYTVATAAFYVMGVAVLHREGRDPEGMRLVSTLAQSYVPVFGNYAKWLFLLGAIAVLYSTYLVANAGNARMVADFGGVIGLTTRDADGDRRKRLVTIISAVLPLACVIAYIVFPRPVLLIAIAGLTQAVMLPILGLSAIYFRDNLTDKRLRPGAVWNVLLTASCLILLVTGSWGVFETIRKLLS
ncbi:MAG: Nramp family divalent metal transporter [Planctomycetaceae bacterium]|nr:Nramp family divalent metal transporter [Planctomycetaceae bacterium]